MTGKHSPNPLVFLASLFLDMRKAIEGNLMGMVGAFIAVAILLGVGTIILGNSVMDCSGLPGYNSTGTNTTITSTGWALTCENANTQAQSAYVLLLIVLIVIAAVVILTVVRML